MKSQPLRIAMIGTGYVGLVSGACFAELGARVICVDRDEARIDGLRRGRIPIYEPGLDALVAKGVEAGRLSFTCDLTAAASEADLVFIAVGTPSREEDGCPDMSQVEAVAQSLAPALSGYTVVVTKSTVPVGSGAWLQELLHRVRPDLEVETASNPEFLREGCAIEDFLSPDRVVIGTRSLRAEALLQQLYAPLTDRGVPLVATSCETAELIKYASNSFLVTKIAFINEMADICEKMGADVEVLARGIGLDKRIGSRFLQAGPGYGGSCFPKDTRALAAMAARVGAEARLVKTVTSLNHERKIKMAERVSALMGGSLEGRTLAVLGVTFKANTDDMRDAPSLDILPRLQAEGARLRAYDPAGRANAEPLLGNVSWCDSALEAAEGSDAALILTEWEEFRRLDLPALKQALRQPLLIDLRNLYTVEAMQEAGFVYHSIGRPPALGSA